jgi:hypothetical protein
MTDLRVSTVVVEVITNNAPSDARISTVVVEVLRQHEDYVTPDPDPDPEPEHSSMIPILG